MSPVSHEMARRLIEKAFVQARGMSIVRFANGLDNDLFAVGDRWLARIPRREFAIPCLEREILVLPYLPDFGLEVPKLLAIGEATDDYPARYLLLERLTGTQAGPQDRFDAEDARRLGRALRHLHDTVPPLELPGDLNGLLAPERFPTRLEMTLPGLSAEDRDRCEKRLRALIDAPPPALDAARAWVHGDLHVRNVLRDKGRLSAIIDWGDSHHGHPALDLTSVFGLLEPDDRAEFFAAYGGVPASWTDAARRRAALTAAVLLRLATEADDPSGAETARQSLERALA